MSILDWLTGGARQTTSSDSEVDTVRRIARQLEELEPEEARYIASFAYILGRVAHADLEISPEETATMERLVVELAGLTESQAVMVVELAKTHNQLFGGTENFLVTREFARTATKPQKLALLECLYAVSAADESISAQEDQEIRRIAGELKLEHSDFIAARTRHARHLDVLKDQ
jgi:uncharacterized tellurite resistance protein B-like protein